MTQATELDSWSETYLISIMPKGGSVIEFPAVITTYDITGGDKDVTSIANAKGGRIKQFVPQTDFEISLEGYATEAGTDTGSTGQGFFDLVHTVDATEPQSIATDHTRTNYLLAIKHTTSTSDTSAIAITTDGDRALRDVFKNGHFTQVTQSFTDGICKFTVKYKCPAFAKDASSNVTHESTDGSSAKVLPAVTYA